MPFQALMLKLFMKQQMFFMLLAQTQLKPFLNW